MAKLSQTMQDVLSKLLAQPDLWQSAYDLGASLGTLNALQGRGLARSKSNLGYFAFPRSNIMWKPTAKAKEL